MSLKTYGIYVAYPPNVALDRDGLGRYLGRFLGAAIRRTDVQFVVACPSWSRQSLLALCGGDKSLEASMRFVGPDRIPLMAQPPSTHKRVKKQSRKLKRPTERRGTSVFGPARRLLALAATTNSYVVFLALASCAAVVALIAAPIAALSGQLSSKRTKKRRKRSRLRQKLKNTFGLVRRQVASFKRFVSQKLVDLMIEKELEKVHEAIDQRTDVQAWYSPTLFWPSFNDIAKPKLVCVPDVVMTDFPISFGYDRRFLWNFETVSLTIEGATDFVTYSEYVKWETLVNHFRISPTSVHCIRHAPIDLSREVVITGYPGGEVITRAYCETLLATALTKSVQHGFVPSSASPKFKLLLYPSQFRPSKNVFTLLRAYEYLLRERFIGHKLILTCQITKGSELDEFIEKHDLGVDVLFLPRLTEAELAACYKLADLAVNPSLFEGGMPFTFTEALSVGTPVVMGDIEATREVLTDPALRALTLFDPYDWKAMADKIEWALANRETLLTTQRAFYEEHLASRTWDDVVGDHIALLDELVKRTDSPRHYTA